MRVLSPVKLVGTRKGKNTFAKKDVSTIVPGKKAKAGFTCAGGTTGSAKKERDMKPPEENVRHGKEKKKK